MMSEPREIVADRGFPSSAHLAAYPRQNGSDTSRCPPPRIAPFRAEHRPKATLMRTNLLEIVDAELHAAVGAELCAAVRRVGARHEITGEVVEAFLAARPATPISVAYPLLVHAAHTDDLRAAVPISAIHVAWLAAARFVDDLADRDATHGGDAGLSLKQARLAAMLCLHILPAQILARLAIDSRLRDDLTADLNDGSLVGAEGQLREYRANPATADQNSVLRCYRGKNGGGFGLAGVMAARLAGADPTELRRWREFGHGLGALRQLRNDEDDLVSGRGEDLRNRVVTYLLTCLFADASASERQDLLDLYTRARKSEPARGELRRRLLDPDLLRRYLSQTAGLSRELHGILDQFGDRPYLGPLHALVTESARPHPLLHSEGATRSSAPFLASRPDAPSRSSISRESRSRDTHDHPVGTAP